VTAGNASGINDGAAAVVVMSASRARAENRVPLARIRGYSSAGVAPRIMGMGPVPAVRLALQKAGIELRDIDLFELNEAFAAQAVAVGRELAVPEDRLNVNGGAIAIGHPIGASGTRLPSRCSSRWPSATSTSVSPHSASVAGRGSPWSWSAASPPCSLRYTGRGGWRRALLSAHRSRLERTHATHRHGRDQRRVVWPSSARAAEVSPRERPTKPSTGCATGRAGSARSMRRETSSTEPMPSISATSPCLR
jgi:hypothetical protein